ncbi:MAG TPA: GNAT family N-acetyltransferase [Actinocrinis sp.]|nr:GNAT family N-acetyltransferase [Actinocrinis sp.]
MIIRELDPSRVEADLAAVLPLWREFTGNVFGRAFRWGPTQLRESTGRGPTRFGLTLAAFAGPAETEPVGFAYVTMATKENVDSGDVLVLLRADQEQDPGAAAAAALLAVARERLAAAGRAKLTVNVAADPAPGYAPLVLGPSVFTALFMTLDLAAADPRQLDSWAAPGPANDAYRLVRWIDRCPDDLVESFAVATAAMDDAPVEALELDHARLTVERIRAGEKFRTECGVQMHVVAAVAPAGEIAGTCLVSRYPDEPDNVGIATTSVLRGHRGHGLGLRIKADSTRWLRELYPETRWIYTFNNHTNEYMLAVNHRMGYQHVCTWHLYLHATGM